jgi:hypothetical protein
MGEIQGDLWEIHEDLWKIHRDAGWEIQKRYREIHGILEETRNGVSKGGRKYKEIREWKSMAATRRGIHGDLGEI